MRMCTSNVPQVACTALAISVLNNTYPTPVKLFLSPEEERLNHQKELFKEIPCMHACMAKAMHTLAITPLIRRLRSDEPSVKQVWFADDSTAGGKIEVLGRLWHCLLAVGPLTRYHPNSRKKNT